MIFYIILAIFIIGNIIFAISALIEEWCDMSVSKFLLILLITPLSLLSYIVYWTIMVAADIVNTVERR
jgi:hypothetical protein